MKISEFLRDKKGNSVIYILLAAGILMIALGNAFSTEKPPKEKEETAVISSAESSLKEELTSTLSEIKGAGKVTVMLTYESDGKKNFGYDIAANEKKTVVLNSQGEQRALVEEKIKPVVRGVIIIADGGGNTKIKESLIRAAQTVLQIAPHKIEVFERNEGNDDGH